MHGRKQKWIYIYTLLAVVVFGSAVSCGTEDNVPTETATDSTEGLLAENLVSSGSFEGDTGHTVEGSAELFFNSETNTYSLVLDEFTSDNGPRLNVYLATNSSASSFTDLGPLTSTNGTLRYDFPASQFNPARDNVLIWCVQFGINFGTAALTAN